MEWVLGIPLLLIVVGTAVMSVLRGVRRLLEDSADVPPLRRPPSGKDRVTPA